MSFQDDTFNDLVGREALHDWLDERPPRERLDPSEYDDRYADPFDVEPAVPVVACPVGGWCQQPDCADGCQNESQEGTNG